MLRTHDAALIRSTERFCRRWLLQAAKAGLARTMVSGGSAAILLREVHIWDGLPSNSRPQPMENRVSPKSDGRNHVNICGRTARYHPQQDFDNVWEFIMCAPIHYVRSRT